MTEPTGTPGQAPGPHAGLDADRQYTTDQIVDMIHGATSAMLARSAEDTDQGRPRGLMLVIDEATTRLSTAGDIDPDRIRAIMDAVIRLGRDPGVRLPNDVDLRPHRATADYLPAGVRQEILVRISINSPDIDAVEATARRHGALGGALTVCLWAVLMTIAGYYLFDALADSISISTAAETVLALLFGVIVMSPAVFLVRPAVAGAIERWLKRRHLPFS